MKTKLTKLLLLVLAFTIAVHVCIAGEPAKKKVTKSSPKNIKTQKKKKTSLKKAMPLRDLKWIKGDPVKFEKGGIYVVEFWATWCGPCRGSIPHLTELQKKYKDKGVTVIGISDEDVETIKNFIRTQGEKMDYTVAADPKRIARRNYMGRYGLSGIPTAFIVNANGYVVWFGHPGGEEMQQVLAMVAAGKFNPDAYAEKKARAEALNKKLNKLCNSYFGEIMAAKPYDEVRKTLDEIIKIAPPAMLNRLAQFILTQVPKDNRDLQKALEAAAKANQAGEGADPAVLNTYALALFENGKIQEAVKAQTKAVELVKNIKGINPEIIEQLKKRLQKYKAADK